MGASKSENRPYSLADRSEGQLTTAILLLATCLLPAGLFLPALETAHFAFWRDAHSIVSLASALFENRDYLLAGIVFLFSIAFPGVKLVWMWWLQFTPARSHSPLQLRILETLGKWSMADVLIIALIVFSFRNGAFFSATPLPGIYVFAAATILAMLASGRLVSQLSRLR